MSEQTTNRILALFFGEHLDLLDVGSVFSGVEIHNMLLSWLKTNPSKGPKYLVFFPTACRDDHKTKGSLKKFLDVTLEFRKNYRTKRYWVKTNDDKERLLGKIQDILEGNKLVKISLLD